MSSLITNKIVVPLIERTEDVTDEDLDLLKEENLLVKERRSSDKFFLFPKEIFLEENYFYNIFDLSKNIEKFFGKNILYLILEKNEEGNVNYIVGSTHFLDIKYHTKGVIVENRFQLEKDILIKMISFNLGVLNPSKIIIFVLDKDKKIEEICNGLEEHFSKSYYIEVYGLEKILEILLKTKVYEKTENKIAPYVISFIISFLIIAATVFFVQKKNEILRRKTDQKIVMFQRKIIHYKRQYQKYEKEYKKDLKVLHKIQARKIYK